MKHGGTATTDDQATAARGVLHGAMALYLTRYLNVPPARVPGDDGEQLDDLPTDVGKIRAALLDAFDRQRQVDLAARLVARHLQLGHSPQGLIVTLARAVLRTGSGTQEKSGHRSRAAVAVDVASLRAIPALPGEWLISGLIYDVAT